MAKYSIHGMYLSPEYSTWEGMKSRCNSKSNTSYKNYGGRGITVCERWNDFANFYADMGKRPSRNHSIDRIDNGKGYSPDNCRWATRVEQCQNTRKRSDNTSGVRGVYRKRTRWYATINVNKQRLHLGAYASIAEAAEARKAGEEKYWK